MGLQNTDCVNKIELNKPEVVVLDKIEQKCLIIAVACPLDTLEKDNGFLAQIRFFVI